MLAEAQYSMMEDLLSRAKERASLGPTPEWAAPCSFDLHFPSRPGDKLTHLVFCRQTHAERQETYCHSAVRLESIEAVHDLSQWRLLFDLRAESVRVHSLKLLREGAAVEFATPEKFHLLIRERNVEAFATHGLFTLLPLTEEARIADVLEISYTIHRRSAILPEKCCRLFRFPMDAMIAKYHVSVRFVESRTMNWKSSSPQLAPEESREGSEVLWTWKGERVISPAPETNVPVWHVDEPWIQISDCENWGVVAAGFARAWIEDAHDRAVAEIARNFADAEPDALARIDRAIRLCQDEFQHLEFETGSAGMVPSPPGLVARRRFGDNKDLAFFLVHLLRRLGSFARPILVNTTLRKSVAGLLPAEDAFDHVVVEFHHRDQTRWVDPMSSRQGGGALNRAIPDYGAGLPIDAAARVLAPAPRRAHDADLYELRETILLDTTGKSSWISAVMLARGSHAETLRKQFQRDGAENFAIFRLQLCANRFGHARRSGALEHRDDYDANEFSFAEAYEISGFLVPQQDRGVYRFTLPNNLALDTLPLPAAGERRAPFALPHPCEIVHTIEIQSSGLRPMPMPRRRVDSSLLAFDREMKSVHGHWTMTLKLSTLADAALPAQITEHRRTVEEIRRASTCALLVQAGHPHPRLRSGFGKLPLSAGEVSRRAALPQMRPTGGMGMMGSMGTEPAKAGAAVGGAFPKLDTSNFPDPGALPASARVDAPSKAAAASEGAGTSGGTKRSRKRKRSGSAGRSSGLSQSDATIAGIVGGVLLGLIVYLFFSK